MSILLALLTVLVGVVVGIVLFSSGHLLLGFVAFLVGIPGALVVWVKMNDRI